MWTVTITIEDGEKHKGTSQLHLPAAATHAQALATADALASQVLALTTGRIVGVELTQARPLPAGNPAVGAGTGDVEIKGTFFFLTALDHAYRASIPAFRKDDFIPDDTDEIDTLAAPVAAFVDTMVNGFDVAGTLIQPSDSRGEDIAYLEVATETYGKKRKKKARR